MTLEPLLREHPFLAGLAPEYLALLAGCARNIRFGEGTFLFREGSPAGQCFLIREGKMALEIAAPGRGPSIIETLGPGEVAGFSWLMEPQWWEFDGRAVEPGRAIVLDGACLRGKCTADPRLGFELMQVFARLAVRRLQATRLRLLDVYGNASAPAG
ncbi:cyclic nucleotide-binding domain-containing protein [Nocardia sp. NPDC101769]|uniref:cyclic nucleotide-binding domain-containing protein n=1 Tax=Nocardia sp. NPDC101769 TaxID=3364333 RepID=UPI00381A9FDA